MSRHWRLAALALLAAAPVVRADISLFGFFHTGDEDTRPEFSPADPVDCTKYRTYPTRFHLTQGATITAFAIHDSVSLDDTDITIDLDGTQRSALACSSCLIDGTNTITLTTGVSLSAGDHNIAVIDPSGTSGNCTNGNDFGWSQLTLVSTATTDSVMLSQRRHIGDNDDADDDYDFTSISGSSQFYPDAFEAAALNLSFTLGANRRLSSVRFYRMRDVNSTDGTVLVNGSQIGTLTTTGDPFTVNTNLLLVAGTHTLRVVAGTLGAQKDDISWDSIILRFASTTTAGTPGFFNAVDVGGNALTGSITTRVAGGAFTLDLYAMNGFGTGQDTTYNGSATVEVLNASNSSGTADIYGCNSTWTVAQTLSSVTFVGGYAQVSGAFLDAGLKEARIKVTDSTTSVSGCSLDNFAIRPASLSIVPSHATESTAGTAAALTNTASSGLPRHKAGQPFTIIATGKTAGGVAVSNYDGSPTAATPVVIAPATVAGTLSLGSWGGASGGARRTDTATYSEVGGVTIGLEDASWANVDSDDTVASQRTITGTVNTGRFVPDHFKVAKGTLATSCVAGGFSYLGSTLAWSTPAVTLTAENAANTTTLNYEGALEKLPATLAAPTYTVYDDPAIAGTPALDPTGLSDAVGISDPSEGAAMITLPTLMFPRTLIGAFDAEIGIAFQALGESDGVEPTDGNIVLGSATAGGGVAFTGNAKSQRFGRLYFEPRYGSERLPMTVPLRAEFFDGVSFVANTADACTTLVTGNVTLTALGGQAHAVAPSGTGRWTVTLSAPGVSGQAGLSIDLAAPGATVPYPLLTADTNGDGTYAEDPATTLTFGLSTQEDRRIYQREVVGN
ncbi:MAG: DUF6701 domain-containing protein [Nevskiaceae bacterium]